MTHDAGGVLQNPVPLAGGPPAAIETAGGRGERLVDLPRPGDGDLGDDGTIVGVRYHPA